MLKHNDYSRYAVVSDLDGTFFGENGALVPRNIEVIREFQALGGHFSFATGRVHTTVRHFLPAYPDLANMPSIMCNGACIRDERAGVMLAEQPLDGAAVKVLLSDLFSRFKYSTLTVYAGDYQIFENVPFDLIETDVWRKAVIRADLPVVRLMRDFIDREYSGRFAVSSSNPYYIELLDVNATKGKMLNRLRKIMTVDGVAPVFYAIGDYENDLDMLGAADVAVCPSNALDSVKRACRHVVCSHTEGAVADLIGLI